MNTPTKPNPINKLKIGAQQEDFKRAQHKQSKLMQVPLGKERLNTLEYDDCTNEKCGPVVYLQL